MTTPRRIDQRKRLNRIVFVISSHRHRCHVPDAAATPPLSTTTIRRSSRRQLVRVQIHVKPLFPPAESGRAFPRTEWGRVRSTHPRRNLPAGPACAGAVGRPIDHPPVSGFRTPAAADICESSDSGGASRRGPARAARTKAVREFALDDFDDHDAGVHVFHGRVDIGQAREKKPFRRRSTERQHARRRRSRGTYSPVSLTSETV